MSAVTCAILNLGQLLAECNDMLYTLRAWDVPRHLGKDPSDTLRGLVSTFRIVDWVRSDDPAVYNRQRPCSLVQDLHSELIICLFVLVFPLYLYIYIYVYIFIYLYMYKKYKTDMFRFCCCVCACLPN